MNKNEPICEYMFSGSAVGCSKDATVFADVVVNGVQVLGFRCEEHQAMPDDVDVMLARQAQKQ